MSKNCHIIELQDPDLAIEFIQSQNLLVEIESEKNVLEIVDCKDNHIESETESLSAEIIHQENFLIEVVKPQIQVEFFESIQIVNEGDQLPTEDFERVISEYEAGDQIQVNRAINLLPDGRVKHADKDDLVGSLDVIGMSIQSATTGDTVKVVKFGKVSGAPIGAVAENFFLGNNGLLLSSAPTTGTWLPFGMQLSSSTFFVNIGEPIRRN